MKRALVFIFVWLFTLKGYAQVFEEYLLSGWMFKAEASSIWLPAEVPGSVQYNWVLNGKELSDTLPTRWSYRTTFLADPQLLSRAFINLVFQGLDTRAEVYLNNKLILHADNMFRSWSVPVKVFMKEGENVMEIRFDHDDLDPAETRKALYHFASDARVPLGIWKPIILQSYDDYQFKDFVFSQDSLTQDGAQLHVLADIKGVVGTELDLEVFNEISGRIYAKANFRLEDTTQVYKIPFRIKNPDRWWPRHLGEQTLYKIGVRVKSGRNEQSLIRRIGLREVEFSSEGKPGIRINGKDLALKRFDYLPSGLEVSSLRSDTYDVLFDSLSREGINLIRVLGSGIYESDYFYDLADTRGILIIQDFMFSSDRNYPSSPEFFSNVREELDQALNRLKHHPSVIGWTSGLSGQGEQPVFTIIGEVTEKNKATLITQDGLLN